MKNLILILFCLLSINLFSQELPDLKAYRNDIGFNTSILVNGIINSNQGPFDFMYKRQKSSNTALRAGASIYTFLNTNFTSGSIASYQKNDQWAFDLSFGKEKQHQLSKKWIFHYGGDLLAYYAVYKSKYYYNNAIENESENLRYGAGIRPFLGVRFQILERLYLATEASLRISYGRSGNTWTWYDYSTGTSNSREEEFDNVNVFAQPAAGIFVFYRF
jgi:hypothetical protein